jgi:DNA-binding transcriptional ArsR family regulator
MVYHFTALDAVFGALADPTRRAIINRLSTGEATMTELARPFDMTLPAVAKHVRVLEEAGLVVRRKLGREQRCRLDARPMQSAAEWMEWYRQFWEHQFDRLAEHLATHPDQETRR